MEGRKFCHCSVRIFISCIRTQEYATDTFVIKQLEPRQTRRRAVYPDCIYRMVWHIRLQSHEGKVG